MLLLLLCFSGFKSSVYFKESRTNREQLNLKEVRTSISKETIAKWIFQMGAFGAPATPAVGPPMN